VVSNGSEGANTPKASWFFSLRPFSEYWPTVIESAFDIVQEKGYGKKLNKKGVKSVLGKYKGLHLQNNLNVGVILCACPFTKSITNTLLLLNI
jgi:hypothetical protein